MLHGIGVSDGIAIGPAVLIKKISIQYAEISQLLPDEEMERVDAAVEKFLEDTEKLIDSVRENAGADEAAILEAHSMIIQDPEIVGSVKNLLQSDGLTAEAAVFRSFTMFRDMFADMEDELMSQRAADLADIRDRVLEILTDSCSTSLQHLPQECILVAYELTPSDTGQMDKKKSERHCN